MKSSLPDRISQLTTEEAWLLSITDSEDQLSIAAICNIVVG
jgi:hypothetical protein